MTDLYRLVYASRNLIQGDDAEIAAAVLQILETSQRNNSGCDVTGALLFNKGAFAQVLEGPRGGVEDTFERIQRDQRHGDVTVLQCGPASERGFANWSMAFVGHSKHGQALWNGLAAESGFDLSRLSGDAVFGMLHDLILDEEGVLNESASIATSGTASSERAATIFDPTQVRAEVAQLRPAQAAAPASEAGSVVDSGPVASTAMTILRSSLADERQRTSELRAELDEANIALAMSQEQAQTLRRELEMWAERTRLLARALGDAAEAVMNADPDTSKRSRQPAAGEATVRSAA